MIYREDQLVFSNFVDDWIQKILYSVFVWTDLFADWLTVLCKFSDSNATFNCPRVSVSVTSLGFYNETSKMAGDTGTISGNLPRLFMRVLGWLLAAVGASGCLLRCSTSTAPVLTPVPHDLPLSRPTPWSQDYSTAAGQGKVCVKCRTSPLFIWGWGGGVGVGENLMFGVFRCVIKEI